MKKQMKIKQFVAIILSFLFILMLISSCKKNVYDESSTIIFENVPASTDELVIYIPTYLPQTIIKAAQDLYQKQYPDVSLSVETFGDIGDQEAYQNYKALLQTELMAGKGPDLVIFQESDFNDLHKVMEAGIFYNIDNFLANDESVDMSAYQQAVFNGGYHDDQRLYIPICYTNSAAITSRETLETFGISLPEQPAFQEWSEQIISYIETHSIQENRKLFYSRELYSRLFINNCGLEILDYENTEAHIDTVEFQQYMEFYKAIYPYLVLDWEGTTPDIYSSSQDIPVAIKNNALLFYFDNIQGFYMKSAFAFLHDDSAAITFPMPMLADKQPYATALLSAAVRNSSPNKVNAYEFLKILLSQPVQSQLTIPVLNTSLLFNMIGDKGTYGYTKEETDAMYTYLQGLKYEKQNAEAVIDIVHNTMLPWVNGEKPYEECLTELQNTLELYLYE